MKAINRESGRLIEAAPIIGEALRLRDVHCLRERPDKRESFCVLGLGIGPLVNSQVIQLLDLAVQRTLGWGSAETRAGDFYIHATIHQLYRGYTRRFMERSFEFQPQRDTQLEALLRRLVARNLDHAHPLDFADMSSAQWTLLTDMGLILVQREFPTGPRPASFSPPSDHRLLDHNAALDEVALQLHQELAEAAT